MVNQNIKKKKNSRNNKKNKLKKAAKLREIEQQGTIEKESKNEDESEHCENVPDEEGTTNKRHFDDNDSDTEEPRKKKKKKLPVPVDTSDKKGKKSIRQMKREKFAERQAEAATVAKNHLKSECINYLSQWKHNRQNWKFMKAKQVWLYKNKFSALIPDEHWPLLLEYFESAQGNIRNMLLDDAKKIIHLMDEWTEKHNSDNNVEETDDTSPEQNKPDETSYKRARDLIQCLQE